MTTHKTGTTWKIGPKMLIVHLIWINAIAIVITAATGSSTEGYGRFMAFCMFIGACEWLTRTKKNAESIEAMVLINLIRVLTFSCVPALLVSYLWPHAEHGWLATGAFVISTGLWAMYGWSVSRPKPNRWLTIRMR
jgi:CDP-diglyceride synthetase